MVLATRGRCHARLCSVVRDAATSAKFHLRNQFTISAIDIMTVNMPAVQTNTSQIAPAVPPLAREKIEVTMENSQVRPRMITYPTILKKRKRRCDSL